MVKKKWRQKRRHFLVFCFKLIKSDYQLVFFRKLPPKQLRVHFFNAVTGEVSLLYYSKSNKLKFKKNKKSFC